MNPVRVLVTRPARDAQHWAQQLQAEGFAAEAFPLIEIVPLTAAANLLAFEQAWQTLPAYSACMFVSSPAVLHFFKRNLPVTPVLQAQKAINKIATNNLLKLPDTLRFMAPGPGTVATLVALGIDPALIDAPALDAQQFDSEALWQVVGQRDWQGRRVLLVRGQSADAAPGSTSSSGRDWLARQLQAAGATIDFLSVYQRRAPVFSAAAWQRALATSTDGTVWLFSSSEAVANLATMPGLASHDWRGARAVVTHPRIADSVRALGWGVVVESRPALNDVSAALGSIESAHP